MDTCCGFSNIHGSVLSCEVDECTPRLSGLRGAARLNGREGVILRVDAGNSARAVVRLADGEEVNSHLQNCQLWSPQSDQAHAAYLSQPVSSHSARAASLSQKVPHSDHAAYLSQHVSSHSRSPPPPFAMS